MKLKRILSCIISVLLLSSFFACSSPETPDGHSHTFSSSISYDGQYHWYASTCGCNEVDKKEEHSYSSDYIYDENYHWKTVTCGCGNVVGYKGNHTFVNNECSVCGYSVLVTFDISLQGIGLNQPIQLTAETQIDDSKIERIRYSSNNNNVSVTQNGLVTGQSVGESEITATVTLKTGAKLTAKTKVIVNDGKYSSLDMTEPFIKWCGRNFVYNDVVNCFNTASGFETTFYGSELKVDLLADGDETPYLYAIIEGEDYEATKTIQLGKSQTQVQSTTIVSGLARDYYTVKLYKATEALHTSLAYKGIYVDGFFYQKPAEKELKIEVYGDSITAGYKNLRETAEEGDNDHNQNGCKTYAFLAAQALNADINVFAREGIGINFSWWVDFYMKDAWNKTYCAEVNHLGYGDYNPNWDLSKYIPDIVIINIGTNDYWNPDVEVIDQNLYKQQITTLCNNIISAYGSQVKIVLAYGMMITDNGSALQSVSNTFNNVYCVRLDQASWGHPRVFEHEAASQTLANFLQAII